MTEISDDEFEKYYNNEALKTVFSDCSGSRLREILRLLIDNYLSRKGAHLLLLERTLANGIQLIKSFR